jgi:hemerythrin-like domain-containing protein
MFSNRISQTLHDEHSATIALMERLESMIGRRQPMTAVDPNSARLLRDLAAAIDTETMRHFDFEENHLFTLLESVGDQLIGDHLTEEHTFMRPLGEKLAALARTAERDGFDAPRWKEFCQVSAEFVQRMIVHVQKEEMALLPLLDDMMDPETEMRLFEVYNGSD